MKLGQCTIAHYVAWLSSTEGFYYDKCMQYCRLLTFPAYPRPENTDEWFPEGFVTSPTFSRCILVDGVVMHPVMNHRCRPARNKNNWKKLYLSQSSSTGTKNMSGINAALHSVDRTSNTTPAHLKFLHFLDWVKASMNTWRSYGTWYSSGRLPGNDCPKVAYTGIFDGSYST